MRILLISAPLAALAGCSSPPASDNDSAAVSPTPAIPSNDGARQDSVTVRPAPAPSPSATLSPEPIRYVGRWAARKDLCEDVAWRFEAQSLATAGEVSCDFDNVKDVAGGYDIAASCMAEGTRTRETIKLRFAASADAMQVQSKTFNPIELIRCER